ncbi:MAG: ABC transporter ATP-binding protein, partial [Longicatena sp.]
MSTKTILRRLLAFVKTSKWLLVFAFLSSIIFVVLNLVAPILIGDAIDDYLAHASIYRVVLYCIALTCVYLGYSLFQWVLMYTSNKIAFSSSATLRKLLYDKMQKLPISFFDSHAHGDLISRYINDIDIVADGLLQCLSTIISGTVSVVFCIAIMLKLNLVMSIVVILSAPFTYLVARTITVRSQKYFRQQASTLGKLNGYSEEMLSQIKT